MPVAVLRQTPHSLLQPLPNFATETERLARNDLVFPSVQDRVENFVGKGSFVDGQAVHFPRHQFKLEVLNECKTDDDALAVKTAEGP